MMLRERNWIPKFEACNRILKRQESITSNGLLKASSHNLNFSIHFSVVSMSVFYWRNENQNKCMEKIQIVTRRFRMRLHASNFGNSVPLS